MTNEIAIINGGHDDAEVFLCGKVGQQCQLGH